MSFWALDPRSVGVVRRAVGLALFMTNVLGSQTPPEGAIHPSATLCRVIVSFVKAELRLLRVFSPRAPKPCHRRHEHPRRGRAIAGGWHGPRAFSPPRH